jgi:hypothetical protein
MAHGDKKLNVVKATDFYAAELRRIHVAAAEAAIQRGRN